MTSGEKMTPSLRTFHIGRECYVVYLGTDQEDIDPFLRIGNKEKIPDEVLNVISHVVLTDRHTGTPERELSLARAPNSRYLGDPEVVNRYKDFFSRMGVEASEKLLDFKSAETGGPNRDLVYFYSNGNINVNYKGTLLFDLFKRESEDLHHSHHCTRLRRLYQKNPFHFPASELGGPGVVFLEGGTLVYRKGKAIGESLSPDHFAEMVTVGLNPEKLTALYVGTKPITSVAETLVRFLKSRRGQGEKALLVTTDKKRLDALLALFPGKGPGGGLQSIVREVAPSKPFSWGETGGDISPKEDGFVLREKDLPYQLYFGEKLLGTSEENLIQAVSSSHHLVASGASKVETFHLPSGLPCFFKATLPAGRELVAHYYHPVRAAFGDLLEGMVGRAASHIRVLMEKLLGEEGGDETALKKSALMASGALKYYTMRGESPLYFFFQNCVSILTALLEKRSGRFKEIDAVISSMKTILKRAEEPKSGFSCVGDFYAGKTPYLFFRSTKAKITQGDLRAYDRFLEDVVRGEEEKEQKYREEEKRLLALIRSLKVSRQSRRIGGRKAATAAAKKAESSSPDGSKKDPEATEKEKRPSTAISPRKKRRSSYKSPLWKRPAFWWLLLGLLLLLGVAIVGVPYLLKGKSLMAFIPTNVSGALWGREESGESEEKPPPLEANGGGSVHETTQEASDLEDTNGEDGDEASFDEDAKTEEEEFSEQERPVEEIEDEATETGALTGESASAEESKRTEDSAAGARAASPVEGPNVAAPNPLPTKVEIERPPRNREEVRQYLNLGRYSITDLDIARVTNKIALSSGYADLRLTGGRKDPNLIVRGIRLRLPDGQIHKVKSGDVMWFLAASYIRRQVEEDIRTLEEVREAMRDNLDEPHTKKLLDVLRGLEENSVTDSFTKEVLEVRGRYEKP